MRAGKLSAIAAVLLALGLGGIGGCGGAPGEREFKAGRNEWERGRYVRARALLEKSIVRRPGSPENGLAYYYLGLACRRLGQVAQALEAFETSFRLDPGLVEARYNTAVIFFDSGDLARAEPLFEEYALARPDDPRALEFMGEIHARNGKTAEARRALAGALARSPRSPRIFTAIARLEARAGEADQALFNLMQALEIDPHYPPALFNLGALYQGRLADAAQAEAYFRKYLDAAARDAALRESPQAEYARRVLDDRLAVKTPAPPAVAPPAAPEAAVLPPPRSVDDLLRAAADEARQQRPQAALNLCLEAAGRAERQGDAVRREKALREAVRLAPGEARAFYALGRFEAERKRHEAALQHFKEAATLRPAFALAQIGLAEAAAQCGEFDSALVACRAAVRQEPENPDALWLLGTLYEDAFEMPAAAAQVYRDFERLFPGDPRVVRARQKLEKLASPPVAEPAPAPPAGAAGERHAPPRPTPRNQAAAVQAFNRAAGFQQQGDLDRAVFFYTRALEHDDRMVLALFNLGVVYAARRETAPARAAYEKALAVQPDLVEARYNLAVLLMDAGDRAGAVEQFRRVLLQQAAHAPSHYALGTLYTEQPGTYELARRHYQSLLAAAPDHPQADAVRRWLNRH